MTTRDEDDRSRRSRAGVAAGVAAGLVGGAAAGLVLGVPGVSGATDAPAALVQQVDDDTTTTTRSGEPTDDVEPADTFERGDRLREVLEPLVEDGTITADQADSVTEHLVELRPASTWRHRGHHDQQGRFSGSVGRGAVSDAVTELLGLDADEVRDALADGSTLAELAEANGVSTETLVDTLIAEATARLDAAVENGRLDEAAAAEVEARLDEQITKRVNGEVTRRDRVSAD